MSAGVNHPTELTIDALARGDMILRRGGTVVQRRFRKADWPAYERSKSVGYVMHTAYTLRAVHAYWDWAEVHQRPAIEVRTRGVVLIDLITVRGLQRSFVDQVWDPALNDLAKKLPGFKRGCFGVWSELRVLPAAAEAAATAVVALWLSLENVPKFTGSDVW